MARRTIFASIERGLTIACIILGLLWGGAVFRRSQLPPPDKIVPELFQEPEQIPLRDAEPFLLEYRKKRFTVQPRAEYILYGLVVSHNDIRGFDIYHDADSEDIKDLCVIWGPNVESDVYQRVSFSSVSFQCEYSYNALKAGERFEDDAFSNNHLLSDDPEVRKVIDRVRIGDQIAIRGKLVDYWLENYPELKRRTSLTRTDLGSGACEVLFADSVTVLAAGNPTWYRLASLFYRLFVAAIILRICTFVGFAWWESYRLGSSL